MTGSPQPVTSGASERVARRDRGRERRHAEAADAGDVPDAAVGDDADAAAGEHPRRQQLAPDGHVEEAAGGEHDDRAGRRRVDRGELVLVRVLEHLVARARGDRERAARDRDRPALQRPHRVLHRLRPTAEPVEDVRERRDGQRGEAVDLGIRGGRHGQRYTL